MIKIEVRQNGTFNVGFPYNDSVDDYFKSLPSSFIKNYGLSDSVVLKINDHKNDTQVFDRNLHEFMFELSEFVFDFDQRGQPIIDEFDRLKQINAELRKQRDMMLEKKESIDSEYEFAQGNIDQLNSDIAKTTDLMNFYLNQIVEEQLEYAESYILETGLELNVIEETLAQNATDFEYFKTAMDDRTQDIVEAAEQIVEHTFYERTLRKMYMEWNRGTEPYYQELVEYFREEYESIWPYGVSLAYGELEDSKYAAIQWYNDVARKWKASLFDGYKFRMEKELKEYSLEWLDAHPDGFEEDDFTHSMANKKLAILSRNIVDVEVIKDDKEQSLNNIFTYQQKQNYLKYREIVLAKLKYIITHHRVGVTQEVIDDYDSKLQECEADHDIVYNKMSQKTYWDYLADYDMHRELLQELNRKKKEIQVVVDRGYIPQRVDNTELIKKAEFYRVEKESLEAKTADLIQVQHDIELEKVAFELDLERIIFRMDENDNTMSILRINYKELFDERISFYSKGGNIRDSIINLLEGHNDITTSQIEPLNKFLDYNPDLIWYDENNRDRLVQLYTTIVNMADEQINQLWNREYGHEILNPAKVDIYAYYFERELRLVFGFAHKHFNEQEYSDTFVDELEQKANKVKKIFEKYTEIAFDTKKNMSMIIDMFEYERTIDFNIEDGLETYEGVLRIFDEVIEDIIAYAFAENMSFKVRQENMDKRERINQVWLDMEKTYV